MLTNLLTKLLQGNNSRAFVSVGDSGSGKFKLKLVNEHLSQKMLM